MPIPRSRTPRHRLILLALEDERDLATRRRIFGGVGQQVHEDLLQAHRIGFYVHRFRRQHDLERMLPLLDQRSDTFHRIDDRRRNQQPLFAQLGLALIEAPDVEQVINQPSHVLSLSFDDSPRPFRDGTIRSVMLENLQTGENGHKGSAQFVGDQDQDGIPGAGTAHIPLRPNSRIGRG